MILTAEANGYKLTVDTDDVTVGRHLMISGGPMMVRVFEPGRNPFFSRMNPSLMGEWYESIDTGHANALLDSLREEAGRHILSVEGNMHRLHVSYRMSESIDECEERRVAWHEAERTLDVLIAIRRAKK